MHSGVCRIAVFASGNGSDLQAIIDACKSGRLAAQVCLVVSNNSKAYALKRAEEEGIFTLCLGGNQNESRLLDALLKNNINLIFLAGYLKKVSPAILEAYKNRIFNIHPSLLPKYGGKGMYGLNVHRAVLDAGEQETGITIHRVTDVYDAGEIVAQKKVKVLSSDTPEALAARVLAQEHIFIVETLERMFICGV